MRFDLGKKVRIINPNSSFFGFEGCIEEVEFEPNSPLRFKVVKREDFATQYRWVQEYEIELIEELKRTKVEIDKNGMRIGKNLFEFNKEGIQIKPFRDYGDDAADAIKYCVEYKKEKEEGEKDNMKILEIYEDRKALEIRKNYKEKEEKIKSEDAFEGLKLNFIKQFKALYKNEFDKEIIGEPNFNINGEELLTKETKEKLMIAEKEKKNQLIELDEFLEEVRAQLELAKDYDTQIKILKRYDILGKDNKINA